MQERSREGALMEFQGDITDAVMRQITDALLDQIADEFFTKTQELIVEKGITDQGTLLKSGMIIRFPMEKHVIYTASYAGAIEWGSRPHRPPVEPLIDWSERKLGVHGKDARRAGWAIALKIAREGTEPRPFIRPALQFLKRNFKPKF